MKFILAMALTLYAGYADARAIKVQDAPYNAVCDGVTDDNAAIHAALAAVTSRNNVLDFEAGVCLFSTKLVITVPHTQFRGDGWGASVLKAKNSAGMVQMIEVNASHFMGRDLTVDGNRDGGGTVGGNWQTSAILIQAGFADLDGIEVRNVAFQGILGNGATTGAVNIRNCYLHHNGDPTYIWGSGYKHIGGADDIRVTSCRMEHNYGATGWGGSAVAMDASGLTMVGNYLLNNYNFGGQIAENGVGGAQRRWAISANQMVVKDEPVGAETAGVEMTGLFAAITGNIITGGRGAGAVWESANGAVAGDAVFVGNFVDKWETGTGVMAVNPETYMPRNLVVVGNKFRGAYGFFATAGYGFLVAGNNFNDVTTPYYVLSGVLWLQANNYP